MIVKKPVKNGSEEHIQKEQLVSAVTESIEYLLESDPAVSIDESNHLKKLNEKQKKLDSELKKLSTLKLKVDKTLNETKSKINVLRDQNRLKSEEILNQLRK